MGFGRIPGAYADVIVTSERCSFAFGFPETNPAMSKGNKSTTYCEMRTNDSRVMIDTFTEWKHSP